MIPLPFDLPLSPAASELPPLHGRSFDPATFCLPGAPLTEPGQGGSSLAAGWAGSGVGFGVGRAVGAAGAGVAGLGVAVGFGVAGGFAVAGGAGVGVAVAGRGFVGGVGEAAAIGGGDALGGALGSGEGSGDGDNAGEGDGSTSGLACGVGATDGSGEGDGSVTTGLGLGTAAMGPVPPLGEGVTDSREPPTPKAIPTSTRLRAPSATTSRARWACVTTIQQLRGTSARFRLLAPASAAWYHREGATRSLRAPRNREVRRQMERRGPARSGPVRRPSGSRTGPAVPR